MSGSLEVVDCCSNPRGLWNLLCKFAISLKDIKKHQVISAEPERCCWKLWDLHGARHLTWNSNCLFQFFRSCLGRPVFCVGYVMQMWAKMHKWQDICCMQHPMLDVVPSCSSLLSRVQVSYSDEEDCEAGDPAFQPSARMSPSSLLLRSCGSSWIACCFICRNENSIIRSQALSNFRYNCGTGFWSSQCWELVHVFFWRATEYIEGALACIALLLWLSSSILHPKFWWQKSIEIGIFRCTRSTHLNWGPIVSAAHPGQRAQRRCRLFTNVKLKNFINLCGTCTILIVWRMVINGH